MGSYKAHATNENFLPMNAPMNAPMNSPISSSINAPMNAPVNTPIKFQKRKDIKELHVVLRYPSETIMIATVSYESYVHLCI